MTLSADGSTILRGRELLDLPVVTLVATGDPACFGEPAIPTGRASNKLEPDAFAAGWAEGRAAAETQCHDDVSAALDALQAAAASLEQAERSWRDRVGTDAISLALEIAELVIGHEVAASADPAREAIERCLLELEPNEAAIIHLNPNDLDRLESFEDLVVGRDITVVADREVLSGDALAELPGGSVDASLASALHRLAGVLGR